MRVILAIFKDRDLGTYEIYGSLRPFFEQYPQYVELRHRIYYTVSRKKQPYEHSDFTLERLNVRKPLN